MVMKWPFHAMDTFLLCLPPVPCNMVQLLISETEAASSCFSDPGAQNCEINGVSLAFIAQEVYWKLGVRIFI